MVSFSASDLVFDNDLSAADVRAVLDVAGRMRRNPGEYSRALAGRTLALLFEKPSLRTRVTFEVAMKAMGGESIFIDCRGEPLGQREPVRDIARNLDRWVDAIAARTFRQTTVEELAQWASIPVINALSDRVHPCQALADMLTLQNAFGDLAGLNDELRVSRLQQNQIAGRLKIVQRAAESRQVSIPDARSRRAARGSTGSALVEDERGTRARGRGRAWAEIEVVRFTCKSSY